MSAISPEDTRLTELLADQALLGLSSDEQLELDSLLAADGKESDLSLATTAAVLELALLRPDDWQAMPEQVHRRLVKSGHGWAESTSSVLKLPDIAERPGAAMTRQATRLVWKAGPWLVAAACLLLAGIAVVNWSPWARRDIVQVVNRDPSRQVLAWGDWDNPEIKGVQGEAVWCEGQQKGYLRFVNLPQNDPAKEQYQLWIVDERGMGQRISGAIFDAEPDGETIVPIEPGIRVKGARLFAVTIEPPGGMWVSDMSRRVTVAAK